MKRGKYYRNKECRLKSANSHVGLVYWGYRYTLKDRERQGVMTRKIARKVSKDVLAGSIPHFSDVVKAAQDRVVNSPQYQKMKDNSQKLQLLAAVHMACMDYLMQQWESLPATEKNLDTFRVKMIRGIKDLGEEARKAIKDADEIEHGKTLHVEKGGFEDELDKILDITPEKIDEK